MAIPTVELDKILATRPGIVKMKLRQSLHLGGLIREAKRSHVARLEQLQTEAEELQILMPLSPLRLRADMLKFQSARHEDDITAWLAYLISAPFLPESQRQQIVDSFWLPAFGLQNAEFNFGPFQKAERECKLLSEWMVKNEEESMEHRYLDLVLLFEKGAVVFETKVGDRKFEKNWIYSEIIKKSDAFSEFLEKNVVKLFLLPEQTLRRLENKLADTIEFEDRKRTTKCISGSDCLESFTPLTWEQLLGQIYVQLNEVLPGAVEFLVWKTQVFLFCSFVEAHVLGLDLSGIELALIDKSKGWVSQESLSCVDSYLKLRRKMEQLK
ncbi:hypothetical protein WDW37_18770 [Bdellovibrionota bacterium FG-1]